MPNPFTDQIVAGIEDPAVTGEQFKRLLVDFTDSLKDCVKREANESLERLAPTIASRNVSRASWVAEVCQALVESGCDSRVVVKPLALGLRRALRAARPLALKLERKLAPKLEGLEDPVQIKRWTEAAMRKLSIKLPQAAASLRTVERFCHAAFTVFALQPERRAKVYRVLQDELGAWTRWSDSLRQLETLLTVLEQEPIVVIDLANRKGFVGKFSGVVDNAQLVTLLMDTYAHQLIFGKPLVSYDIAQCARGLGPREVPDPKVRGCWNLYSYRAFNEMYKLPEPKDLKANKHWIWNDRKPADIPALNGFRVILIGPPSYEREWMFTRAFQHLKADIKVEHELTKLDLQIWLDCIFQANFPQLATPSAS